MIRTFISTTLLITSAVANASWYIGLGLGPDMINFHQRSRIYQLDNQGAFNFDVLNKVNLSGTGIFGTLFGGYEWLIPYGYYMAVEVNGNLSSAEHKQYNHEYVHLSFANTNYKMSGSFGVSALPGVLINSDFIGYARLGYANGYFKSQTTDVSLQGLNKSLDGFRAGVGFKTLLFPCFSFRMEYSHIQYGKVTFFTNDNNTPKFTKIYPQANQVEFGFVYSFDSAPVVVEVYK